MALPTRKNAENIDAGWFNSIKAAIEGSAVAVKTITFADSPYSILVTDGIILVDTTGGSVTLTPPLASSFEGIRTSIVKTVAANSVIVTGIRTSTTINEAFEISSDGTNYIILNDYLPNITSDLLAHVGLSSTHGASGDIVGETNTQSLTNKTIDADNNTISNLAHGSEVDDPSSGVHGAVGTIVGTSDTQTLSNKTFSDHTIFQDSIYCANEIAYGVEVNVQSGTDIIMTVPAKPILQLVDGSLVSIDDIADGTDGQAVILTNNTGVDLVINNDSSKIITGTGENLDFKDDSSIWLVFDITTTWRIVGGSGSGGGGAGLVTQNENITSATTGSFATSSTNLPILTARFWDASIGLGEWSELDPASLDLKINSTGTSVSYNTTTFTFAASDFIQISAIYPTTTNSGTEYDSGWVLVSAINGLPSAAFHRVDLPDGFTTTPAGYTLTIDDGSNVFPGDVASRLVFDDLAGVQRIAVETTGLGATDLFRIRSSVNTLAADSQAVLHIADTSIHNSTKVYTTVVGDSYAYTILDNDGYGIILVPNTASNRTVTLPAASDNTNRVITIKNTSTDKGAVLVTGTELIDGFGTIDLDFKNCFIEVVSDGTVWQIINTNITSFNKSYDITASLTGNNTWATARASSIAFRDIGGMWYSSMFVKGSTGSTQTSVTLQLSGATFLNVSNLFQPFYCQNIENGHTAYVVPNTDDIEVRAVIASDSFQFSGTVQLNSKPTFVE